MTEQEVFKKISENRVAYACIGFNLMVVVHQSTFKEYEHFFTVDKYQKGKFRSQSFFKHLHATPIEGGYMNVHWDHGNPNRSVILGTLLHAIFDVVPWSFKCLVRLGYITGSPSLEEMKKLS